MTAQLVVSQISKRFGGLSALSDVTMNVDAGEFLGLIGPNGSGKTTFLNVLSGFYIPEQGSAEFEGKRIDGREPSQLAGQGIVRSFQVTKIFRRITVLDNLLVPGLTRWADSRSDVQDKALAILSSLRLERLAHEPAANLSGGQAKLLEFARIMMLDPKLVLLDEPFGGVHPELKALMHETLRRWNQNGVTVMLISHDMGSIFGLCRRIVALQNGRIIADGDPESVRSDQHVLDAYLGGAAGGHAA